jgi:hypothetical protein
MDDLVSVHVVTGADELNQKEAGLGLGEVASATKYVHEGAACAKLECHVHVALIFKAVLEADNIRMLERPVYLDFGVELRLCMTQITLWIQGELAAFVPSF